MRQFQKPRYDTARYIGPGIKFTGAAGSRNQVLINYIWICVGH